MSTTPAGSAGQQETEASALVRRAARAARDAQRQICAATRERKDAALEAIADHLLAASQEVLAANEEDLIRARDSGMTEGLVDRLTLTDERVNQIARAVREIASLTDPVGEVIDGQVLPNGLRVRRVRVPLGVVGMIYEARPNVTVDVTALTLKSGNAVILRGGSAARATNASIVRVIRHALRDAGLPEDLVSTIDAAGRDGARELMQVRGLVDVLVPRGGAGLIRTVVDHSRVPVIETGSGNCHVYVDAAADLDAAVDIIVNAKTQRVGVCNAAETMLVHSEVAAQYLPAAARALWARGVTLHADAASLGALEDAAAIAQHRALLVPATDEDWGTEYGSADLSVAVVADLGEAIAHIDRYSTRHTEAIISQDVAAISAFIDGVDSAAVMVNASTRFTDGGQLGLGAELGISTQKVHARGPMGLHALTSVKWVVEGSGHVRP